MIIAVLAASGVSASLTQTLLIPIIGDLPRLLNASPSNASWAITATLLTAAVSNPIVGRLGDAYGKRRMLILLLFALFIGSVICALTTSLWPMLIGRSLQGVASAAVPLGMAILRDALSYERVFGGMAVVSATMGIGSAVGLPLAAFIARVADWHLLFWISAILALSLIVAVMLVIPKSVQGVATAFDGIGAFGLATVLILLLIPLSKGTEWGWGSPLVWGQLSVAVVVGAGWSYTQMRRTDPLVDLRLMRSRSLFFTNAASLLMGFALFSSMLVIPQVLQIPSSAGFGFGLDLAVAGFALMPAGVAMLFVAPLGGRLTQRAGARPTLVLGLIIVAAGYGVYAVSLNLLPALLSGSLIIGMGMGFAFAAVPALIMNSVPSSHGGVANGVNALIASIGSSIGSAIIAAVLLTSSVSVGGIIFPSAEAFRLAVFLGGGSALVAAALASLART